jgi:hypothetical protein
MLTTINVAGIDSAYPFLIPDERDSTQVEQRHEPIRTRFERGEREKRVHDI